MNLQPLTKQQYFYVKPNSFNDYNWFDAGYQLATPLQQAILLTPQADLGLNIMSNI